MNIPILRLYSLEGDRIYPSKENIYKGILSTKPSDDYTYQTLQLELPDTSRVEIQVQSRITNPNVPYTTSIVSETLDINQEIELYSLNNTFMISNSSFSLSPLINTRQPNRNSLNTFSMTDVKEISRRLLVDLDIYYSYLSFTNTFSNDYLLSQLQNKFKDKTCAFFKNLKFPSFDASAFVGTVHFEMSTEATKPSPVQLQVKVSLTFDTPINGISRIERFFKVTRTDFNFYTFDPTEIFYDESKWKFNRDTYYAPIDNLINTFPISGWVDWVDIDTKATNLIIVLEHVGNLRATFDVSLRSLSIAQDYQYNLNAGTTWNVIRLHGTKIQISSLTNGATGTSVKLINAFFYK